MSVKVNEFSMKLPTMWKLSQVNVYKINNYISGLASPRHYDWHMPGKTLHQVSYRDEGDDIYAQNDGPLVRHFWDELRTTIIWTAIMYKLPNMEIRCKVLNILSRDALIPTEYKA